MKRNLLNLRFGQFSKEKIQNYLNLSTDEILNSLYQIKMKSSRKVNKEKQSFIYAIFDCPIKK